MTYKNAPNETMLIPCSQLDSYPNHPFTVKMDDDMTRLVNSIREEGIRQPILIKKKQDHRFVILSGHRRVYAARLCGLDTVPAIEVFCSDHEADMMVCQMNLHRSKIDYRSQCRAVKFHLEAMNHQGKKNGPHSAQILAKQWNVSEEEIRRMTKRARLSDSFFDAIEKDELGKTAAVHLSELTQKQQAMLFEWIAQQEITWSFVSKNAVRIKNLALSEQPFTLEAIQNCAEPAAVKIRTSDNGKPKASRIYDGDYIKVSVDAVRCILSDPDISPERMMELIYKGLMLTVKHPDEL